MAEELDALSFVKLNAKNCAFTDGLTCTGLARMSSRGEFVNAGRGVRLRVKLDLSGQNGGFPGWKFSTRIQCELYAKKKGAPFAAVCRNLDEAVGSVLGQVSGNPDKAWAEADKSTVRSLLREMVRRCLLANIEAVGACLTVPA